MIQYMQTASITLMWMLQVLLPAPRAETVEVVRTTAWQTPQILFSLEFLQVSLRKIPSSSNLLQYISFVSQAYVSPPASSYRSLSSCIMDLRTLPLEILEPIPDSLDFASFTKLRATNHSFRTVPRPLSMKGML